MPNNGTLRLPLKPMGLHDPEEKPDQPEDPVPVDTKTANQDGPDRPTIAPKPSEATEKHKSDTSASEVTVSSKTSAAAKSTSESRKPKPTAGKGDKGDEGEDGKGSGSWWDWITGHINKVWDKITGTWKNKDSESDSDS